MLGVQHQYHGTGASTEDVPLMSAGGGRRPPPDDGFGTPMPGGFDPALIGNYGNYDDDQQSNVRYGRIPQRQPRRYKTIKRIELQHGNLVLDCKVPAKLLSMCPLKDDREFTHMRYTAATCDVGRVRCHHEATELTSLPTAERLQERAVHAQTDHVRDAAPHRALHLRHLLQRRRPPLHSHHARGHE